MKVIHLGPNERVCIVSQDADHIPFVETLSVDGDKSSEMVVNNRPYAETPADNRETFREFLMLEASQNRPQVD